MDAILLRTVTLFAIGMLTLSVSSALACSCEPQTVEQAKQDAVAIFEGRVTAIAPALPSDPDMPELIVTFEVARSWRGADGQSTVIVRTAESSVSCGYAFTQGASYLVYASDAPTRLQVHHCSRTRPTSEASEDLAALGEGVIPRRQEPAQDGAPPQSRRGGCASRHASASASPLLWLSAAAVFVFAKRPRRRS